MKARLDDISRKTIARFGLKLLFALIFAALGKGAFLLVASYWLSLYGTVTAVVGVIAKDRMAERSFNHWDEVLWLTTASLALLVLHRNL
ncbi:hypothetical protein PYV00_07055 [Novosphingobium sp. H3SJ31-1]|uniref:Uncharacterized protein n=2 Tax=Novosphingobium album (ex Liu et al. 2023) TaxID=3031130 RepID=A0ABT5WP09_9SPHN|nr:hypothetical protein [Novosphingobium album (ex Liu et al. 2023)]